jgi:hypothetical protein
MLMADPVVRPPARQHPNSDFDDEHPKDEDERLDFENREPLPSSTL